MNIQSALEYLFQQAPLPVRASVWILTGVLLWLAVSFPARWIWLVATDGSRQLKSVVKDVRAGLTSWRARRLADLNLLIAEQLAASLQAQEDPGVTGSALAGPVQRIVADAKSLIESGDRALLKFKDAVVQALSNLGPDGVSLKPAGLELYDEHFRHRTSLSRFVVSAFILVCVVPVNAVMLSEILTETGMLPRVIAGLPFSPAYPVAFVLTMIEAAFGWVYHTGGLRAPSERDMPERLTFGRLGLVFAIAGIASVEGFFYGLVGSPKSEATAKVLQLGTVSVDARVMFTLWGILIVACLCAVAATAASGWFDLVERSALARYKADLEAVNEALEGLRILRQDTERNTNEIAALVAQVRVDLGLGDQAPALSGAIEALRRDMLAQGEGRFGAGGGHSTAPERAIASRSSLYLALTLAGFAIVSVVVYMALSAQFANWPQPVNSLAAAGLGLLCVVLGSLLQPRLVYLKDTSRGLQALNPPSSKLFALLGAGFAATGLVILSVMDRDVAPIWILAALTGSGLLCWRPLRSA